MNNENIPSQDPTTTSPLIITPPIFIGLISLILLLATTTIYFAHQYLKASSQTPSNNQQFKPVDNQATATTLKQRYELVNKQCKPEMCLIQYNDTYIEDSLVEGVATLSGYFTRYADEKVHPDFEHYTQDQRTCNAIIVEDGTEKLINNYQALYDYGNRINKITNNKLVINLDLSNLDTHDYQLVTTSFNKLVKLNVIKITPSGSAAPPCYSDLIVLNAIAAD